MNEDWHLKILIEEDEDAFPVSDRFTAWITPAVEKRRHYRLCIGIGATRAEVIADADAELRGALELLKSALLPALEPTP